MALRVLLADESINIKKSIQVSLQDFGVEVRSVPVGVDVLPVAREFKPDIVLADILLAKLNGYEVCSALKGDPQTRSIPVVLMWSVFMELDETKFKQCRANGRLEKPFDKDKLRSLVNDLVPKTQTNELTGFLTLPDVEIEDKASAKKSPPAAPKPAGGRPEIPPGPRLKIDDNPAFAGLELPAEETEEFEVRPLGRESGIETGHESSINQKSSEISPLSASSDDEEQWSQQQIGQFQIGGDNSDASFEVEIPDIKVTEEDVHLAEHTTEFNPAGKKAKLQAPTGVDFSGFGSPPTPPLPNEFEIEEMVRQQVRESIESAIWKILPDIAERVIRDELEKLLKEAER